MVSLVNPAFWKSKKVLITGHNGFKGGWLCNWLCEMDAEVNGFSLNDQPLTNTFWVTAIGRRMQSSTFGNITDRGELQRVINKTSPEVVFHLAAQPLVRASYNDPLGTYMTNVIGTLNLLDLCRESEPTAVVVVTSDKCYKNYEKKHGFKETDELGGHDPYSSSKACTEILTQSMSLSFLENSNIAVATARAGNVIGGGDWSKDRLVPDAVRSILSDESLAVRNPEAVRPWQHVLDSISGYLALAQGLVQDRHGYSGAWNFGPNPNDAKSVRWILENIKKIDGRFAWHDSKPNSDQHEAMLLTLDSNKAKSKLHWSTKWSSETAILKTMQWYKAFENGIDMARITEEQIAEYVNQL